jgi:peptide/nickel transport system substrate-binding protein
MRLMKNKLFTAFFFSLSILFFSCETSNEAITQDEDPNLLVSAEGGKFYGGELKINSIVKHSTLFPASISDVYSQHISSQIYEGLLKYNQKTLVVEPCIAENFEVDVTNKVYTFTLRKNVFFHDNDCFDGGIGREVKANDVKSTFEFLCSNNEINKSSYLLRDLIKGGKEYAEGKSEQVSGLKVLGDYKFQIELVDPFSGFTGVLAMTQTAIFPKEALDKYGEEVGNNAVGAGPYQIKEIGENLILSKNKKYWRKDEFGNQMPFISQIKISFIDNKTTELELFKNGELDFIWSIPVEEIPNIMGSLTEAKEGKNREFVVQSVNSLQTQYYGFNLNHEILKNKKVRQAFNYAINRDSLVDFILEGEGIASHHGIIPAMQGYPTEKVKGFTHNKKRAKQLLKEAGYPNGKNFPTITISYNKAGQINELIANAIKHQLESTLNINLEFAVYTTQEISDKREDGSIAFWRYGWIADYPDPSNFMSQFHSKYIIEGNEKSYNLPRYNNPEFDKLIDQAMLEMDETKRMNLYAKAEQLLIDDAVIMPIYFASEIRLVNPQLMNFDINELEFRDFSTCYFVEKKENKKPRVYDNIDQTLIEEDI